MYIQKVLLLQQRVFVGFYQRLRSLSVLGLELHWKDTISPPTGIGTHDLLLLSWVCQPLYNHALVRKPFLQNKIFTTFLSIYILTYLKMNFGLSKKNQIIKYQFRCRLQYNRKKNNVLCKHGEALKSPQKVLKNFVEKRWCLKGGC